MTSVTRRPAFILFGDLHKVAPYLADLGRRNLAVLLIAGPGSSSLARRATAMLGVPDHPFAAVTDVSLRDSSDLTGIVDQAVRWQGDYDIAGALVTAEVYVEPGEVVCDLLGLPRPGFRAARVCRNKSLQRRYLREWSPQSVLVPGPSGDGAAAAADVLVERTVVRLATAFGDRFPLVVKPLTLESSIGVRIVRDATALRRAVTELGTGAELLVEERVGGREYNVDGIVTDGKPINVMITQKGTNEGTTEFFVELVHTTPPTNLDEDEFRRIAETHAAVIERLDFRTGMAHAEYRLTDDGQVVLMEIAARAPGDACLPLYHLATGNPVEPVLIDAALGVPTSYSAVPRRQARQIYFDHAPGVLADVRLDWPENVRPSWLADTTGLWPVLRPVDEHAPAHLHELLVLKSRGERLLPITESANRAVTAVFDAPFDTDIDTVDAQVRRAVAIDVDGRPE